MTQKKVFVRGMHCRSCELLLEEDLGKLPQVQSVRANFRKGTIILNTEGTLPSERAIAEVVEAAGYAVSDQPEEGALPWFSQNPKTYAMLLFALGGVFLLALIGQQFGWFTIGFGTAIDPTKLSLMLLVGLAAGVSTCAALIGGLVLGLSSRYSALHPELSLRQRLVPQVWFHAGRVLGFAFFGALLGYLGERLSGSIAFTALLTLLAGGVMVVLGVQLSEVSPRLSRWSLSLPKGIARFLGIGEQEAQYSHRGAFLLGGLTFFLPCGFTQAVQVAVIASGSALLGAMALPLFALGTMPGLLALGSIGASAKGTMRSWIFPLVAVILLAFGFWNITSGLHLFGIDTSAFSPLKEASDQNAGNAPLENGVQVVRMTQDALGYHPKDLPTLRLNVPAKLIVTSTDSYTCASSLVIPAYGIQRQLQPGENIIEFTPKKVGNLAFSCGMGMFRGSFQVAE